MCEIMTDPVRLPTSDTVLDRLTLKKHLLSDKTDPFNRMPLKEEDLVEMPLLKEEILSFIEQKRQEKIHKNWLL